MCDGVLALVCFTLSCGRLDDSVWKFEDPVDEAAHFYMNLTSESAPRVGGILASEKCMLFFSSPWMNERQTSYVRGNLPLA